MGLRGPGAVALKPKDEAKPKRARPLPWLKPGLKRWQRVVAFLEFLPITSGPLAGQNFRVRDWQASIIEEIYGDGPRVIRLYLLTMPRKNGKTVFSAGLALCHLLGPESEERGQVYSAAADRDQASLIFSEMEAVIRRVPEFRERCNIQRFHKKIEDLETGSIYAALSSDDRKAHGKNTSMWIYDELAQARNGALLSSLETSTGARAEPLGLVISTQSSDDTHPMSELVDDAQKLLDGIVVDPSFGAHIYRAPDDADIWDEKVWFACNPALDDFRSLQEMRDFAAKAKRTPSKEAAFRNLYLNQRVDAESFFIGRSDWNACSGDFDLDDLDGQECYAGLDLSMKRDLTAFVLVFPRDDEPWPVLPFLWVPGHDLRGKEDADRVPYLTWKRQGFIIAPPGRTIDYGFVAKAIGDAAQKYDLREIRFDRWRIDDLQRQLDEFDVNVPLVPHGQGFKDMSPAVEALEELILSERLAHKGHPVLAWNAACAVVTTDPAGGRKIAKDKSTGRVDGLVALAMACRAATAHDENQGDDFGAL